MAYKFKRGDVVYDFVQDELSVFILMFDENNALVELDKKHNLCGAVQSIDCFVLISKGDFA